MRHITRFLLFIVIFVSICSIYRTVPDGAIMGNWVGMDMGRPVKVSAVRIVPRGDDNDIHPGDLYELKYWDGRLAWVSRGIKMAEGNTLTFDSIPQGALIWVSDKTRGWDERPFLMDSEGNVEWW